VVIIMMMGVCVWAGDVVIVIMHPMRLLVSKDWCLAFSPGDPTVRAIAEEVANAVKIARLEQVRPSVG
jgi:hypothetical protein